MFGYTEPSSELMNLIKPYIKRSEDCKVSGEIEFNGKAYREVIFSKRNFKSFKNEQQGYIYISSDNSIVSSKNVQKELAKLAHYYEIFFSGEKAVGILAALQAEGALEVQRGNKEDIITGLDFLFNEGVTDAARVKEVVNTLPELREESSIKIETLASLIKKVKETSKIL
jgi:post-segregation antitoxin (ccd killing protein)